MSWLAVALAHVLRGWVAVAGETLLMPMRVRQRERADFVEAFDFGVGKIPGCGGEVVAELLLVARADDDGIDAGFARYPVQCDLRNRNATLGGDLGENIDDAEKALLIDGAGEFQCIQARFHGLGLAAPEFPG